jgi:PAS domain S-box-containing protein
MRALLDAMPDIMIRFRRDGTYVDIRGDVKGLVRPREEMIGRNVRDFLPSPVVDELMQCADAALGTRTTQTVEYELDLDGEQRIFEARMVPSADDEIVSIVREVTLARRLERELSDRFAEVQHEQMFTRTVVNTAPIVLMLVDGQGGIIRFNDTTERLTGRVDDERVWGQRFWEVFVHPEDVPAVEAAFRRVSPGPELEEVECRWLTASGDELILACTFNHIVDGQGAARRIIAGLDVTERERSRLEIRASRARLVEAQDAERRRLERNLHDGAQQRLVSLSLALRLAQAKLATDPEGAGDILTAAGDELALALAELRELARGIHPAMLTDRGLGAAVESLAIRAPLPVELAAMPDERLPAPVEAAAFYVISEALANIGKYAQATAARVSVTRVDGHAVVEVDDDGVGGADPGGGSGLRGLLDRVEALDGTLEVSSPDGGGTRIRAEIPCPR